MNKIKVCLRYLGGPGYQNGIGEELGASLFQLPVVK